MRKKIVVPALLLSALLLFSACGEAGSQVSFPENTGETSSGEQAVRAFGLWVDGELTALSIDKETLLSVLDDRLERYLSGFSEKELVCGDFLSDVWIGETECLPSELSGEKELLSAAEAVVCTAVVERTRETEIPYETVFLYHRGMEEERVLREGEPGKAEVVVRVTYEGGEQTDVSEEEKRIVTPPVNEEILTGEPASDMQTLSSTLFVKPFDGRLSSTYGETYERSSPHLGIDIIGYVGESCRRKTAVAAADGVVETAEWYGGYGNFVLIRHENELETAYGHFDSLLVTAGQTVKAGDPIGLIGTTGDSTGYHLHFEVRLDGKRINPLIFLNYER